VTPEAARLVQQVEGNGHLPHAQEPADWPLYDGADDWEFPAVQFAIEQILPLVGICWWGGMPKRFKSLMALYVALAIACRRETIAKRFPIAAYPKILYIAREDGGGRLKERRDDILAAWGTKPAPGAIQFMIKPHFDLMDPAHMAWLRDTCIVNGVTLVVLDTWTALSPAADPLGPQDQAVLAAAVVQLAEDIRGLVIVVDHSRKNRPDGHQLSSADIFGPPQKWAAAEHIIMLGATDDPRRIEVFIESKDGDTGRFFLAVSPRGSGEEKFSYAGSVGELAEDQRAIGDANRRAVLEMLQASPDALSVSELADRLTDAGRPLSKDTIQRHLTALLKTQTARRSGSGKATRYFALAFSPQGPSAAQSVCGDE
jgi:DNA-binding transcriptional ArsR family regulator